MEAVLGALALTLVVGSLCGLVASARIGALSARVAKLEARVRDPSRAAVRPTHAVQVHAPPPPPPPQAVASVEPPPPPRSVFAPPAVPVEPPPPERAPEPSRVNDWWKSFELRAGTRWTSWLGAAALVVAAALFVRHAIHMGWLGPALRLGLGAVCGAGLLLGGLRAERAKMRPLAQGLFGAGLGVLYVSSYVAFASHGLIPRELAFGAMVTVTLTGCIIAVLFDAQAVAVLALLGGLFTPLAVSSGDASRDALFTYLLVLDVGVVALAMIRRWRALELIAVAGTWLLFGGFLELHHVRAEWREELAWLAAFHVLFLVLPFGYHLRRQIALAPGRLSLAVVNATAVFAGAVFIVDGQRNILGVVALVMAASYHALGAVVRRRLAGDGRAHFGFTSLAVVLATASVPLLLRDRGITLAWSLEAPVLLALGFHYRHFPIRLAGLGVLALAATHLLLSWPLRPALFDPGFLGAMTVPLAALAFAGVHGLLHKRGDERDRWLGVTAAIGGLVLATWLVHVEIRDWLMATERAVTAHAVAPLAWAVGAMIALATAGDRPRRLAIAAGAGLALTAAVFAANAYSVPLEAAPTLALNLRFVAAVAAVLAAGLLAIVATRRDPAAGRQLWLATLIGLGILIGAEAYTHYAALAPWESVRAARARGQTAVTIAWAGYAAALLVVGFVAQRRTWRLAGLGLLGVVATKLVIFDLAGAAPLHRVLSFLIIGALMIVASWAYHRLERRAR